MSPSSIWPSVGTENLIPEEMDHREIAVRVPVMNEVQFLFPSEPCKPVPRHLKYVGDAVIAMFPVTGDDPTPACGSALTAAQTTLTALQAAPKEIQQHISIDIAPFCRHCRVGAR